MDSSSARNFKSKASRWLYKAHLFIGIFVSVQCLVLFLTGSVLLFRDEIEGIAETSSPKATSQVAPELYASILHQALTLHPHDRPLSIALDEHDSATLQMRMGIDGSREFRGARRLAFDSQTGYPKTETKNRKGFFDWTLELHRDFLMGAKGKLYVGLLGLLYVFTLISGFIIYGVFSKKRRYGEIRPHTPRTRAADLHKFLGASVFAWAVLIGLTGLMLAFNSTLIKVYQYTELRSLTKIYDQAPAAVENAPLEKVIASAQAAMPEAQISFIAFPNTEFSIPGHFFVLVHGTGRFSEKLSELIIVDAAKGEALEVRELPLYLKMLMLSEPLHFGDYGGPLLKAAWLLMTILTSVLPISGLLVLYRRKRRTSSSTRQKISHPQAKTESFWLRPYTVPALLFLTTSGALTWALLVEGAGDHVASLFLGLPAIALFIFAWVGYRRAVKP